MLLPSMMGLNSETLMTKGSRSLSQLGFHTRYLLYFIFSLLKSGLRSNHEHCFFCVPFGMR